MKIFSNDEIKAIEMATLRESGISRQRLIQDIGESLACEIIASLIPGHRLVIFAGPELNGAYTLEAARYLWLQGYKAEIYLFNIGGTAANNECCNARDRLMEQCGTAALTQFVDTTFEMPDLTDGAVTVIDGIFGSERTTPLMGGYQSIVRNINDQAPRIISVDVPSGLLAESTDTLITRNIIHATLTLAIGMPRVTFLMRENAGVIGNWRVIPVDFSQKAINSTRWKYRLVEKSEIKAILPPRDAFVSKADLGNAILFAGSYGMMGAAVLAARGALRAGAGKVTVHTPRCGYFVMQTAVPSALCEIDPSDTTISNFDLKHDYQAVAIGPGIGTADNTLNGLDNFLRIANAASNPVVLDADALNCLALRPTMLSYIPVRSVLTPHAAEFDRLFGQQPSSYARLLKALDVAERYHIIIVLKGRFTAIVRPDGKVYFNPTGSSALATAGSGDVLTGVIAAFIAQGITPELAAVAGAYVHGLAGEMAAKTHGTYGTTAADVADLIGRAIKSVID